VSAPSPTLRSVVDRVRRALRRDTAVATLLLALCAVPLTLIVAWMGGLLRPWSRPGPGPLLLDLTAVAAAAAVAFYCVHRWLRRLDEAAVAADAERRAGVPAGTVRGALELARQTPPGTSRALARRAEAEVSRRFAGLDARQVSGELGVRVRRRRILAAAAFTVLTLTAAVLGFTAPEHARTAWSPLANPVRAMTPPPMPALRVAPGDVTVTRGSPLSVQVAAPGRDIVIVRWRAEGDVAREEVAAADAGTAAVTIPRIDAVTEYWVSAPDGATSRRYRATPVDPLLVSELGVDVIYPSYVGRGVERFVGEVPPLELPAGTQLVVQGRTTRPLAVAELAGSSAAATVAFGVEDDVFSGGFAPTASGLYAWRFVDRGGEQPAVVPAPLQIRVLADAPPVVEIRHPASDTILDATLRQPVLADARDDHGLVTAAVVSWRVDRHGRRSDDVEAAIALNGDDRALIRTLVDGAAHDVLPGDTLKFFLRVTDNSPRRQTGVSRIVALRLPAMDELRRRAIEDADALLAEAATAARSAAELQQTSRGLERRAAAANTRRRARQQPGDRGQEGTGDRMAFADAAESRRLAERQEELLQRAEALRENIERLEQAMQQAGLHDSELKQRLDELRQLYEEMLTPEVRQQLEQLRAALDSLDPEAVQAALESMAQQHEQLREQLDRSLETMRRAAEEQRANSLSQEARELATQQQALARSMAEGPPSPAQAEAQRELAERAQQLARELEEMQQRLQERGEANAAERAGEAQDAAQQAREQMEQAARSANEQDGAAAAERGEAAARQMESTADALDEVRRAMADGPRSEARESVQQAVSDALALAQRQQELAERMRDAELDGSITETGDARDSERAAQDTAGQQRDTQRQDGRPGRDEDGEPKDPDGEQPRGGSEALRRPRLPQPPQLPQLPQPGQQRDGQDRRQGGQDQPRPGQQAGQQGQGQQSGEQPGQQQGQGQQGQQGQQGAEGQQGRQGQQGGAGERQGGGQAGAGSGPTDMQTLRAEQAALQQGLRQLSRNLQEASKRSAVVNREVGSALARANMSMQQTMEALQRGDVPRQHAEQTVESLNRLALSLLNNAQQAEHQDAGSGAQQALPQLADLARRQGSLAGQSSSLVPMNLSAGAVSEQLDRLAAEQMEIARRLGGLPAEERERIGGDVEGLAREAGEIATLMGLGQLPPDIAARQERLFHRLLDAGRALEKDEFEETRTGERPGHYDPRVAAPLDSRLFEDPARYRAPSADELATLPPVYRRLILDYFERLNRPAPPAPPAPEDAPNR
jgi:hypothetical protein